MDYNNIILNEMVSMCFGQLLLEAMSLSDIKRKWYNDVDDEAFANIVQADPTYSNDKPDKIGQYAKWLLNIYKQGKLKLEDLYKATQYLTVFDKAKRMKKLQNADINRVKSLPDLYEKVRQFLPEDDGGESSLVSQSDKNRQISSGAEKVFESDEWIVIVPHTMEAAIKYGKGTQWCTAATDSHNYFNDYNCQGKLYIIMDKYSKHKYQFHFETNSFMDENDRKIDKGYFWEEYDMGQQLCDFFKEERPDDWYWMKYNDIGDFCEGFATVASDDEYYGCGYNFINEEGLLLSDIWFSYVENFSHGWALVGSPDSDSYFFVEGEYEWEYNFINKDGDFISKEGFKNAKSFKDNEEAAVETMDGKQRILLTNGGFKETEWNEYVTEDWGGFKIIKFNNKYSIIDGDGDLFLPGEMWFDNVQITNNGDTIILGKDGMYNIISTKTWKPFYGTMNDFPFERINWRGFVNGCVMVRYSNKTNYLRTDGVLLSDKGFDDGRIFCNGYALVGFCDNDGKVYANFINTEGKFTFNKPFSNFRLINNMVIAVPYKGREVMVDGSGNMRMFENFKRKSKIRLSEGEIRELVNKVVLRLLVR